MLRGLEDRERVLQETLVTTQRVVEEMKDGARREATLVVREAEVREFLAPLVARAS